MEDILSPIEFEMSYHGLTAEDEAILHQDSPAMAPERGVSAPKNDGPDAKSSQSQPSVKLPPKSARKNQNAKKKMASLSSSEVEVDSDIDLIPMPAKRAQSPLLSPTISQGQELSAHEKIKSPDTEKSASMTSHSDGDSQEGKKALSTKVMTNMKRKQALTKIDSPIELSQGPNPFGFGRKMSMNSAVHSNEHPSPVKPMKVPPSARASKKTSKNVDVDIGWSQTFDVVPETKKRGRGNTAAPKRTFKRPKATAKVQSDVSEDNFDPDLKEPRTRTLRSTRNSKGPKEPITVIEKSETSDEEVLLAASESLANSRLVIKEYKDVETASQRIDKIIPKQTTNKFKKKLDTGKSDLVPEVRINEKKGITKKQQKPEIEDEQDTGNVPANRRSRTESSAIKNKKSINLSVDIINVVLDQGLDASSGDEIIKPSNVTKTKARASRSTAHPREDIGAELPSFISLMNQGDDSTKAHKVTKPNKALARMNKMPWNKNSNTKPPKTSNEIEDLHLDESITFVAESDLINEDKQCFEFAGPAETENIPGRSGPIVTSRTARSLEKEAHKVGPPSSKSANESLHPPSPQSTPVSVAHLVHPPVELHQEVIYKHRHEHEPASQSQLRRTSSTIETPFRPDSNAKQLIAPESPHPIMEVSIIRSLKLSKSTAGPRFERFASLKKATKLRTLSFPAQNPEGMIVPNLDRAFKRRATTNEPRKAFMKSPTREREPIQSRLSEAQEEDWEHVSKVICSKDHLSPIVAQLTDVLLD